MAADRRAGRGVRLGDLRGGDSMSLRTCRFCGNEISNGYPMCPCRVGREQVFHRFGLTLVRADFDRLGEAFERINEAERKALQDNNFHTPKYGL